MNMRKPRGLLRTDGQERARCSVPGLENRRAQEKARRRAKDQAKSQCSGDGGLSLQFFCHKGNHIDASVGTGLIETPILSSRCGYYAK